MMQGDVNRMSGAEQLRMMERSMHVSVADAGLHVKRISHISPSAAEERPTLVFLHEGLGSVAQWKSFPFELCRASGCDGVVYDRPGYGKSSPLSTPRRMDYYRSEVEVYLSGLLEALNIRRPLLVGHSDGGTIALLFASRFPARCVGLISEAAHVIIEEVTLQGVRNARQAYTTTDLREKLQRYHGGNTDGVMAGWADVWLHPGMADWDMLAELEEIRCPVLVVQGENDNYGSRRQVDLIDRHVAGRSEILWLENCGHLPHHEARPRVLEAMTAFIDSVSETKDH